MQITHFLRYCLMSVYYYVIAWLGQAHTVLFIVKTTNPKQYVFSLFVYAGGGIQLAT